MSFEPSKQNQPDSIKITSSFALTNEQKVSCGRTEISTSMLARLSAQRQRAVDIKDNLADLVISALYLTGTKDRVKVHSRAMSINTRKVSFLNLTAKAAAALKRKWVQLSARHTPAIQNSTAQHSASAVTSICPSRSSFGPTMARSSVHKAMEALRTKLNDVDRFDEVIRTSLPDCGDMEIITKDAGMQSGRGIVMITFSVQLPDGTMARAQSVTTMRMFRAIALAVFSTYSDEGYRENMADPLNDGVING